MSSPQTCSQCGTELPAGVPAWLCPKCLLIGMVSDSAELARTAPDPILTTSVAESTEPLPQRLGGYELLERIGQGGMGVVHRAVNGARCEVM